MIFIFYDINRILTYNAFFNFLIGERGVGKTFSSKKFVISKFLKKKEKFIYLRRYKTEIDTAKKSFFNDVAHLFKDVNFSQKGNNFFINDEVCGYALPLSTANILKSVCYDDVTTIIFDEFIIDKGCYHYLSDEVKTFLEFCETVFRLRDNVRVLFLANAITQTNPYFLYFNLTMPTNTDIKLFRDNLILLQLMKNDEYRNKKKLSRFGRLIDNTVYGDYAINNDFLRDSNDFIESKKGNCTFSFAFIFKNETFGVWINFELGKMFISSHYDKNSPYIFTTTLENHKPNTLLLKSAKQYKCWANLLKQFKIGNVYFESIKIKNIVYELFSLILS